MSKIENNVTRLKPSKLCPICTKKSEHKYHPFCSIRCANVDLNRWLCGAYVIEGDNNEDENSEQEQL